MVVVVGGGCTPAFQRLKFIVNLQVSSNRHISSLSPLFIVGCRLPFDRQNVHCGDQNATRTRFRRDRVGWKGGAGEEADKSLTNSHTHDRGGHRDAHDHSHGVKVRAA